MRCKSTRLARCIVKELFPKLDIHGGEWYPLCDNTYEYYLDKTFFEILSFLYIRKCCFNVFYCRQLALYVFRHELRHPSCNCATSYCTFTSSNLATACCQIVSCSL